MQACHLVLATVMLTSMMMASAAYSQTCPKGEKRLEAGDECIPELLFNYLYCLERSGGGKVEISRKSGDEDSGSLEIQLSGKGSGVVLKGEGAAGFKKEAVTNATRELQEKLDPSLAAKCERLSSAVTITESALRKTAQPPAQPSKPAGSHTGFTIRGAFDGFSCDVSSYGGEWAEENRQRIRADLYSLYGCSVPPSAHIKTGFRGDFHTPTDSNGPWKGFAARSTVLYYHSDNKSIVEALARDLSKRYQHRFVAARGGGQGILPEWYKQTIIVHLREEGL